MQKNENILKLLTVGYFVIAFTEVIAEYMVSRPIICALKPIIPLVLIAIYYIDSDNKISFL